LPIQPMDSVVAATGTKLSALGPLFGTTNASTTAFFNAAEKYTEARMMDGPFTARWLPRGAPAYRGYANGQYNVNTSNTFASYASNTDQVPGITVSNAGSSGAPNAWNGVGTNTGAENGQYALFVIFDGDTTSSAQSNSNVFAIDVVWNWEIIPRDPTTVAYTLSTSLSDPLALSSTLNRAEQLTLAYANPTASAGQETMPLKGRSVFQ